jgi:serine/threonine protein kinase
MQIVAVKQIQLEDMKTEEIAQLVHEVDLVKRLSHPKIIKYEGMVRDNLRNTLSMVVECVFIWLRYIYILTCCVGIA